MTANVRVSVVVPVYNMEEYLDRCLLSVVDQTYSNLEIILIDDGSTDGSAVMCREWERKDNRIVYIWQENAGLGGARNSGIKAASSDYITFLDADDWFEPTFVEKIIKMMLETSSDMGQCDMHYVDSATMNRHIVKIRFGKPVVSCSEDRSVMNKSRICAWGKIYRKELLERCDFSFPSITYEDTSTPVLIASANQVCYVPEPLINYCWKRPGSLSNDTSKIKDIGVGLQLLHNRFVELDLYDRYMLEWKKIALGLYRFACRMFGETGNESAKIALNELEKTIARNFPQLQYLSKKKFFAVGTELLATALDNSIPYKEQLTTDISEAECVVFFESDAALVPKSSARLIAIPDADQSGVDPISASFNIAELIMERL